MEQLASVHGPVLESFETDARAVEAQRSDVSCYCWLLDAHLRDYADRHEEELEAEFSFAQRARLHEVVHKVLREFARHKEVRTSCVSS